LGVYIRENMIFKITQTKECKVTIINYLCVKIYGNKIKINAFCDVWNIRKFSKFTNNLPIFNGLAYMQTKNSVACVTTSAS